MVPRVKICGITNYKDALEACRLGAWALGFNFFSESRRFISLKDARAIIKKLPKNVEKVGIFVNASTDEIKVRGKMAGITMVQLHGDEKPEMVETLSYKNIIKAFRPKEPADLNEIKEYETIKYILIDAAVSKTYGGSGQRSDWGLAKKAKEFGKVILAGGLTPDNIGEACKTVTPFAVDVTSGIEKRHGIKDLDKMKKFFEKVKASGK